MGTRPGQIVNQPAFLVFARDETRGSSMIGGYPRQPVQSLAVTALYVPSLPPWIVPFSGAGRYFSFAKLDEVRTATVFLRPGIDEHCTGVLFQYNNGGSQAVGLCPLESTECREYTNPKFICLTKMTMMHNYEVLSYQTKLLFFGPENDHQSYKAPCCNIMRNAVLHFWFTAESTFLQISRTAGAPATAS